MVENQDLEGLSPQEHGIDTEMYDTNYEETWDLQQFQGSYESTLPGLCTLRDGDQGHHRKYNTISWGFSNWSAINQDLTLLVILVMSATLRSRQLHFYQTLDKA